MKRTKRRMDGQWKDKEMEGKKNEKIDGKKKKKIEYEEEEEGRGG